MRHGELRVDRDGAPEMGYSGTETGCPVRPYGCGVSFESFERGSGCLLQWSRVFFDCGQRFADPCSELSRNFAQCIQDVFFPGNLNLLLIQDAAGLAVFGSQAQDVLASKACDRGLQK